MKAQLSVKRERSNAKVTCFSWDRGVYSNLDSKGTRSCRRQRRLRRPCLYSSVRRPADVHRAMHGEGGQVHPRFSSLLQSHPVSTSSLQKATNSLSSFQMGVCSHPSDPLLRKDYKLREADAHITRDSAARSPAVLPSTLSTVLATSFGLQPASALRSACRVRCSRPQYTISC
jgi:hypothetical protein